MITPLVHFLQSHYCAQIYFSYIHKLKALLYFEQLFEDAWSFTAQTGMDLHYLNLFIPLRLIFYYTGRCFSRRCNRCTIVRCNSPLVRY